jgi:hypothetical protein
MARIVLVHGAFAGCDPVLEIDTDHAPWISRTDELVESLKRIVTGLAR